jgi:curved DNA-binding protein CbpA
MSDNKDYYEILGIQRNASPQDITDAWRYWVNILHPDRMSKMPEHIRKKAEEDLKKVNEAYSVLSDPRKRAEYDRGLGAAVGAKVSGYEQTRTERKPKVEVYPAIIYLDSMKPRAKQKGTFFIRNIGGVYSKVLISNPEKWIKIKRTESLYPGKKLPMRVDIEAIAPDRGKTVGSEIRVRVDEAEASVRIEVSTRVKR